MQQVSTAAPHTPPPSHAEFPETVQLASFGKEPCLLKTPPPSELAEFPEIVQPMSVGEEFWQQSPPPDSAEFLEMVQRLSVGEESSQ
jgi:hypothetical protein